MRADAAVLAVVLALTACSSDSGGGADPDGGDAALETGPDSSGPDVALDASDASTDVEDDAGTGGLPPTVDWELSWTEVATHRGAKPILWVDGSDQVHLAWLFESQGGWVKYARYAADARPDAGVQPVEIATGYFYGPIGVSAQPDGRGVVNYHDHDREDQVLALEEGSANSFDLAPMTNAGHDGWDNSVFVDASGVVHTATVDPSGFSGLGVHYGRYADGAWTIELAAPGSFDYAGGTAIGLLGDDRVVIAYFDDQAGEGGLAVRSTDGTWGQQTLEPRGSWVDIGRFPSFRVADDGQTLHLVYVARDSDTSGVVRYASGPVERLVTHDLAEIADIAIGHSGARNLATLALDGEGRPVVAWQTRAATWVARVGSEAVSVNEVAVATSEQPFGQQTSIGVDNSGRLHLTYWTPGGLSQGASTYLRGE